MYLKKWNQFEAISESKFETDFGKIIDLCVDVLHINPLEIHDDGTVDVGEDVNFSWKDFDRLPIKFGRVDGSFFCPSTLTTLEGSPQFVQGTFYVGQNITSLEGGPLHVVGRYDCSGSKIKNLKGSPNFVGDWFVCGNSYLTSLEGAPDHVVLFYCVDAKITNLVGMPKTIDLMADFRLCTELSDPTGLRDVKVSTLIIDKVTPISGLREIFPKTEDFINSLDYGYISRDGKDVKITKWRWEEALAELDIKRKKPRGYSWA